MAEQTQDSQHVGSTLFESMKDEFGTIELISACIPAVAAFLRCDHFETAKGFIFAAEKYMSDFTRGMDPKDLALNVERGQQVVATTLNKIRGAS